MGELHPAVTANKGGFMKTKAGLWIDHHEAIIVDLTETGEQVRQIQSKVDKQHRRSSERAQVSNAAG